VKVFVTSPGLDNASLAAIAIEIADDGIGFSVPQNGGRGLNNMRRRAEELGARLTIGSVATGTTVRIELPFESDPNKELAVAQAPVPGWS
jgi:signal transduction histidine kinase